MPKKIIDIATLLPEQQIFLLIAFAKIELWLKVFEECNPKWIPILQEKTNQYLTEILTFPKERQLSALQEYLTVDDD